MKTKLSLIGGPTGGRFLAASWQRRSSLGIIALLLLSVGAGSAKAEILSGNAAFDFTPNPSVVLSLSVDSTTNMVDILMSGRSDGWFAIGFGRRDMDGTYAIVVDQSGAPSEYRLANFGFGNSLLSNQLSLVSSSVVASTRSVHLRRSRDLGGSFPDHYVFPVLAGDIDIAGATGAGAFGFHSNRDGGSITLSAVAVPEPTGALLAMVGLVGMLVARRRSESAKVARRSVDPSTGQVNR